MRRTPGLVTSASSSQTGLGFDVPVEPEPTKRDFDRLSTAVERLTDRLEDLPNRIALIYLRQDVYARDQKLHERVHNDQQQDIDSVKGWQEWAVRIIVGAFLLGLAGLLWSQR